MSSKPVGGFGHPPIWAFLMLPTVLGLAVPGLLAPLADFSVPLLFAVMVFSLLDVPLRESFKKGLDASTAGILVIQYAVSGVLALMAAQFFDPALLIGFIVAGVVPSGISAPAMVSVFRGNTGKAFAITAVTYAFAPLLVPLMILLLAGQAMALEASSLFQSVLLFVAVPIVLVVLLRQTPLAKPLAQVKQPISLGLLLLLVSGQVAQSAGLFYEKPGMMAAIVAALVFLSLIKLFLGMKLAKNRPDQIAFAQLAYHKNGTLALTLLSTLFSPAAAAVAVAHIISSQFMFVFMAWRFKPA